MKKNWQEYIRNNDKKKKTIKTIKQIKFQKNIVEVILKNEIWKVAKWTKEKNQLSKKISRLSNLRLNDIVATTFKKNENVQKQLFFPVLNTDLSDISNFTYVESLTLTRSIDKKNQ